MHERLNDASSDDDYPDSDLLAFNVEMGMVPMSSINSSGALATESTDLPGALPRPRRARLNSHSVPLGKLHVDCNFRNICVHKMSASVFFDV